MDHIRINRLTESDFDVMIKSNGGKRISEDETRETKLNADYIFYNTIIELKLIEEEGFEKKSRQNKISSLFSDYSKASVCVIDTQLLTEKDVKQYYNIIEGPIKNQVKKASKQLEETRKRFKPDAERTLIIVNNP